eukprot:6207381-Pleurochrysis_carterae.AAC.1
MHGYTRARARKHTDKLRCDTPVWLTICHSSASGRTRHPPTRTLHGDACAQALPCTRALCKEARLYVHIDACERAGLRPRMHANRHHSMRPLTRNL